MDTKGKADVVRFGRAVPLSHLSLAIALRGNDAMRVRLQADVGCIPVYAGYEAGIVLRIDGDYEGDRDPMVEVYTIFDNYRDAFHFRASKLKWPGGRGMRDHAFDAMGTHFIRKVVGMPTAQDWPSIEKADLRTV